MNTLKITDRNRPLTERHDLEEAKTMEAEILGAKRKIYCPCNLNLVIDRRCNCECGFCFSRGESLRERVTDEEYLTKLKGVLKSLRGLPIEITITGGEPTLCPERLIPVMRMVKEYGFSNRTFSTNGTGLLERIEGKPLLQYMKENGCIYNINLSRMSADDAENRKIFGGDTVSNREIEQIAYFAEVNDMDLRLSCNLLKGAVDSWERVRRYMAFYRKLGIASFVFREIIPKRESSSAFGRAAGEKGVGFSASRGEGEGRAEHVSVSDIVEGMRKEREVQLLRTAHGVMYDVDIYGYENKLIKHYRGRQQTGTKGCAEKDKLTTFLVYEEGELRTTW